MSPTQCNTFGQNWQHILSELVIKAENLAQSSQRKSKMSVEQLVQTLVLGCLEQEKTSLRLWSEVAADLGCEITTSSIDERLTERVVMLLYIILQWSIEQKLDVSRLPVKKLEQFCRVILYDATLLTLPPILKRVFQGSRDKTMGQMKLQVGYDYLNAQLQSVNIHEGIEPDQKDKGLLEQTVKGSLLIFDLGYFDQLVLAEMQARKAFFVTRYQSQTGLYDLETEADVDLVKELQDVKGNWFEAHYKLGRNAKVEVRLVARRVSQQETEKRRREVQKRAKSSGYTASQRSLIFCDWDIIITNLSDEWTAQEIMDLYGVRWQIELVFKAWKSYLDLGNFGYWRAERILCQLYATLIGAVLCQSAFASVRYIQSEASLFKAFRIIRRHISSLLAVIRRNWWGLGVWTRDLKQVLLKFGQQQNLETAPSTLRRLMNWG